jgi:NADH-quinone oxidoreductase subunit G
MSDGDFQIEIDGRSVLASRGEMIIHVADREGVNIPRFCYHEKLSIAANCRMCLVEVERAPKPLPACATPVMDGMKISTNSEYARQAQKSVMEFLLINHPLDCPICDQGGECELQDLAIGYGDGVSRFAERKRVVKDKNLGPLIASDMTRCIHCTRCVRFGEEIAGMPELGSTGRGEKLEIGTYIEKSIESELSGNVIDVCPVGALTSKPFRYRARTWEMQSREAVAAHDSVGSNVYVHIAQRKVMRVVPRRNDDVNETWISDRDRFSYEGMYSDDRLEAPQVKTSGSWAEVDWEDAIAATAEKLKSAVEKFGVDEVGVIASPNATTEELYLLQKVARGLGLRNIDHRLREADFRDQGQAPLHWSLGRPIAEFETLGAALVVGSNSRKEIPLVNHRLRKAAGAGAAVSFLNAVDYPANFKVSPGAVVSPAGWVRELAALVNAAGGGGDVPAQDWHKQVAADLKDNESSAILLGALAASHPQAAELRALAAKLAALTGASAGMLPHGANQAGAALAGVLPHRGPGGASVDPVGMDAGSMISRPRKVYVLLGVEPEFDCLNGAAALAAMKQAECVISLSAYDTEQVREYADVILPIALFAETDGSYVNSAGTWQSMNAAVAPFGQARPAWKILRVIGNALDFDGFEYMRCESVRQELRSQCPDSTAAGLPETGITPNVEEQAAGMWQCAETPMYSVDALVRRAGSLHRTPDGEWGASNTVQISPAEAERLGIADGQTVTVGDNGSGVELVVQLDSDVADGCARIAAGVQNNLALGGTHSPVSIQLAG